MFKPRFAAIDAHNHLGRSFGGDWPKRSTQELKDVLDESGIEFVRELAHNRLLPLGSRPKFFGLEPFVGIDVIDIGARAEVFDRLRINPLGHQYS